MNETRTIFGTARGGVLGLAMLAGFASATGRVLADPPVAMAPPLGAASPIGTNGEEPLRNTGGSTVFSLKDITANQKIPLSRAVFDQRGYQLFGREGETIVVPFVERNLYVMKFAPSADDAWYFVNDNGAATLLVPRNGYLDNATEPGAKWYPFAKNAQPEPPVQLGIAPIYNGFLEQNWFSNTPLYGGNYGFNQFSFAPGWTVYSSTRPSYNSGFYYPSYNTGRPTWYNTGFANHPIYSVSPRPRDGQVFSEQPVKQNAPASSPRYMGNPNFLDSRDRAPGPVYNRPTGYSRPSGNRETRPAPRGEARNENKRPESKRPESRRAPGGSRSGGRYNGG